MADPNQLEGGTYEVLRNRLDSRAAELESRLNHLNTDRQKLFGSVPFELRATERIATGNNCTPRDMVAIGPNRFLFGFNVHIGLRAQTNPSDVFAVYDYANHHLQDGSLELIQSREFEADFAALYKYYRDTVFAKFSIIQGHLFMVFRIGKSVTDIKTFKWRIDGASLHYIGNRSDHEYVFPNQQAQEWKRAHRGLHQAGRFPHISIEDRLFVETTGGDLTIKIENNTDTGEGIYAEPVEEADQTLDDAEVFYAILGSLVLLKIRPYQEETYRYFIFNDKTKAVERVDEIGQACCLLPDDQGLIFPGGLYLLLAGLKRYPNTPPDLLLERHVLSPNGEDHLYAFYHRLSGTYLLMVYNLIDQQAATPVLCNGFTLFENGEMLYFREEPEPQKHHTIQIWQTPFTKENRVAEGNEDHLLAKIGNAPIVRAMAECRELLTLLQRQEGYADIYVDLAKKAGAIADGYFWIDDSAAHNLKEVLEGVREDAGAAIDEFEKVVRARKRAEEAYAEVDSAAKSTIARAASSRIEDIRQFVDLLGTLRKSRGEAVGLREIKYTDPEAIETLETSIGDAINELSGRCVQFLLGDKALTPYTDRIQEHEVQAGKFEKTAEAARLEEEIAETSRELDLLNEIVGNLKIDDPTQATEILSRIAGVYSPLKQVRAEVRRRKTEIGREEAAAHFSAQLQLLEQSAANLLDLCDTTEQCDEGLAKTLIQIEEMEGKFADYDEYLSELHTRRDALFNAFEARRVALVEAKNKRAQTLMASAERVLQGVNHRLSQCKSEAELNTHFTSDLMVDRVRQLARQLVDIGDSVKADDLLTQLKTTREEALRQITDKADLYTGDGDLIQLGDHQFSFNRQPLDLTLLPREGQMIFHITGTQFFEPVEDVELQRFQPYWDRGQIAESPETARAETLAYLTLTDSSLPPQLDYDAALEQIRKRLPDLLHHGYSKGVHDEDAAKIVAAASEVRQAAGLLQYSTEARAAAILFEIAALPNLPDLVLQLDVLAAQAGAFPHEHPEHRPTLDALTEAILHFLTDQPESDAIAPVAARYLAERHIGTHRHPALGRAGHAALDFGLYLREKQRVEEVNRLRQHAESRPFASLELMQAWLSAFAQDRGKEFDPQTLLEAAAHLLQGDLQQRDLVEVKFVRTLTGMRSDHDQFTNGEYPFDYYEFLTRLSRFVRVEMPAFEAMQERKKQLAADYRKRLRLDEFKPAILSSFVRNQLIDQVYLPFIGDNLAKQIGAAGDQSRTDRMGLLLLISPPGYGKTTLMEYVADRLGITLVKINGPALGHATTSLDPQAAPDAGARQEIIKLNLAFEMGDNVMIYIDDIQHCHPEFLQKFISLCDGTRRIEGVRHGQSRVFNLRGRKVAVVMAGNPYTESGEQFKIPDMLANRADTYNLGDIVGGRRDSFELSYLENSLTSNSTLAPIASRNRKDFYQIVQAAASNGAAPPDLEGNWSAAEVQDMLNVTRKLMTIRDGLLKVNATYIASAAQADAYRTEPPFKLQGSYRNMNRLAEKVAPIMNEAEVQQLLLDHYRQESQTLTSGAEANLLKFKELIGAMTPEEAERWESIKSTFSRNQLFDAADKDDPVGRVVVQLSTFKEGLDQIGDTLKQATAQKRGGVLLKVDDPGTVADFEEAAISQDTLARIWELIQEDKKRKAQQAPSEGTS